MSTLSRVMLVVAAIAVVGGMAPASAGAEEALTYFKDVAPIIQNNCQTCHRPAGFNLSGLLAPMSLMSYEETRPWARAIDEPDDSEGVAVVDPHPEPTRHKHPVASFFGGQVRGGKTGIGMGRG